MIERGDALPERIKDLQAHICSARMTVPDPMIKPGEGTARVCLSAESTDGARHYRQFRLELIDYTRRRAKCRCISTCRSC